MALIIAPQIREKLANKMPPVSEAEVRECFWNRTGKTLVDDREEHKNKATNTLVHSRNRSRSQSENCIYQDGKRRSHFEISIRS